jgi:phage shock protein PspC (stress-responsive transcriptional regulator)
MIRMRRGGRRARSTLLPVRPSQGRLLGGVCTALSDWLAVDVTLVRLAFILLSLAWGLGIFLYGLLWIIMASADERQQGGTTSQRAKRRLRSVGTDVRTSARRLSGAWGRAGSRKSWPRPLDRRWIALTMMLVGILVFLASLGAFSWLTPLRALGLAIVIGGAAILLSLKNG